MAKQLETITVTSPGFFGVNTQDPWKIDPNFCLEANNCVIDKMGRVGTRKGWKYSTTTPSETTPVLGLSYFQDIVGKSEILSWSGDGRFYKGTTVLEELSLDTPNFTIPEGDWTAVTLNDHQYFFQKGQEPLVYSTDLTHFEGDDPVVQDGYVFQTLTEHKASKGHQSDFVPKGGIALAAYGRVFVADTDQSSTTVYFSSLLDGGEFGSVSGIQTPIDQGQPTAEDAPQNAVSTAGAINISALFTKGTDVITGLAAINGYLVILCRNSLVVFGDTNQANDAITIDPLQLQLVEIIQGVGCVASKSVQNVGDDVLFLSDSGVKSLGRTIQEKSQPFNDISVNVKSDIIADIVRETPDLIRSVYSDSENFYLVSFPSFQRVYCFDTKAPLDNGSLRATTWSGLDHTDYQNIPNHGILLAQKEGIARYDSYEDNLDPIPMSYVSPYLDLGNPTSLKILKKLSAVLVGASSQSAFLTSSFDFSVDTSSYPIQLQTGAISLFNEAQFGIDTYGSGIVAQAPIVSAAGTGNLIQIGFKANVTVAPTSIQKLDIFLKQGRTI